MNNKHLYNILIALALPVVFYFVISGFKSTEAVNNSIITPSKPVPGPSAEKDFVNYILNSDYSDYSGSGYHHMENFLGDYRAELNFNGVHIYDADTGTSALGWFNKTILSAQETKLNSLISGAHTNNLKAIYERNNLSNLCYAQRLVYEVSNGGSTTVNDGFCWQNIAGDYGTESNGTTYIYACTGTSGCISQSTATGYIAQNIYENFQHTDLPGFRPQVRDIWDWHLKPRMKIRQSDFEDPNKQTLPVVTIEAYCFNDGAGNTTPIATKTILVRNFSKQGVSYSGDYKEIFYNGLDEINMWIPGDATNGLNKGRNDEAWAWGDPNSQYYCAVDFKVYWHGNVDVWLDKLTVDDFRANKLFNTDVLQNYDPYIEDELDNFGADMDMFFVDELVHSQIPAAKYVVDKVRAEYPDVIVTMANTNYLNSHTLRKSSFDFRQFIETVQPDYFQIDAHPFYGSKNGSDYWGNYYPDNITPSDSRVPTGTGSTGWKATYAYYTNWLQNVILGDRFTNNDEIGSFIYQLRLARDQVDDYSPGTRFVMQPQIHGLVRDDGDNGTYDRGLREPLDEEYSAQAMISIAHGADGLCWFWFQSALGSYTAANTDIHIPSYRFSDFTVAGKEYTYGLINTNLSQRTQNMWGQDKWEDIGNTNAKILSWKPILDNSTWAGGYSIHSESADAFKDYIDDIKSIKRDPSSPYGYSSQIEDASNERYWELGFYDPLLDGNFTRYFMMVNRRCVPDVSNAGDFRQLKIKFDGSQLMSFQNWSVTDVITGQTVVFARNSTAYHDFGEFKPGEGKLYRIAPTFIKGGTLVTNEDVSGETFTCEDTVLNGGYNITIDSGTTVSFTDSATIIMTGGEFTSGVHGEDNLTTYKGLGSANWNGMRFTGSTVKIYNSKFQDIASPVINYAVSMLNCPLADIRTNEFVLDTDTSGAVQSMYADGDGLPTWLGLYINYNSITMANSRGNAIAVQGFAGLTIPVYCMNNTMTSGGYASGVMLSTITGGAIKKNNISGFSTGVNLLFSSVDLYGNIISNTSSGSKGIMASGSTTLGMIPSGGLWLGGFNEITNSSGSSTNIEIDNSVFILDGGKNSFDISSSNNHLYGSFWDDAYPTNHRYNCFAVSGGDITSPTLPNEIISSGESEEVELTYLAYTCGAEQPTGTYIADIGNGLYDTIQSSSEGPGGGGKGSMLNKNSLPLNKGEIQRGSDNKTTPSFGHPSSVRRGAYVLSPSQLYDSARVNMRRRNYTGVKTYCAELIGNYPSTYEAISSLQLLYMSSIAVDTTTSGITALKTYYESLILNNGSNTALVKISNYLVQKCKVSLGNYSSALSGFQQIINNNPYSYEGLLARWDYMATSLLAPGGGGESMKQPPLNLPLSGGDGLVSINDISPYQGETEWGSYGDDDKSPFTKEQKQDIRKSVNTAFEITKNDDDRKLKTLEENTKKGDVNSAKELRQMKTLKEIVKTERPKTMIEHIRIVSSDVQKVFGSTAPVSDIKNNNVPEVFSLWQNFPNPFNPVTTIKYALPKDVKVVIKIYDILGREIRTLVNEIRKAGYYDVKFDMSSYASGVYFYRIEADNFVQSKKMVLVK